MMWYDYQCHYFELKKKMFRVNCLTHYQRSIRQLDKLFVLLQSLVYGIHH